MWRWLLRASAPELLALPMLEPGQSVDDVDVCDEARWLIGFWLGSGDEAPRKSLSAWSRSRPDAEDSWCRTIRSRLASQVDKIRHWQIIEGDYSLAPDVEATWFVDPPYQVAGDRYPCGATDIDFAELGAWCRARRGQTIVCENAGAEWLPFRPFRTIQGVREAGGSSSAEAIWTNDIPPSEQSR